LTVEGSVVVTCHECDLDFDLSARNAREHRRKGMPDVCGSCRHLAKPPDARMLAVARRWWLDRFTLDELRAWPPI
jgi:hypothetical protein